MDIYNKLSNEDQHELLRYIATNKILMTDEYDLRRLHDFSEIIMCIGCNKIKIISPAYNYLEEQTKPRTSGLYSSLYGKYDSDDEYDSDEEHSYHNIYGAEIDFPLPYCECKQCKIQCCYPCGGTYFKYDESREEYESKCLKCKLAHINIKKAI